MKTIQAFAACTMALVLTVPATAATRPEPEIRGLSGILSDIQCQEYAFSAREDGALSAPNRSQDLRSRLTSAGLHLASRRNESAWSVDLRLARFGRESSTDELAPTIPGKQGSKVVFSRDGIAEWYRNDARGLEQGFDVPGRPPKDDSLGRLALEMTVRTSLQPVCGADRRSVIFRSTAGEPILRYAELKASDAGGRDLPAELTLTPQGGLRILVDDRGAHYPVTIDPIVTSPSWTMSGDESNAYVGYSVASAGDVNNDGYADVIVGAPLYDSGQTDEGKVFVLHGSSSGLVSVNWTGEGNQAGAEYGYSVASAGDVNGDGYSDIIVGAPFWESGSNQTDEGAAYIYLGSSTGLATTPNRTLEGDQAGAHFGLSVASAGHIDGDAYGDIIVGAPGYTNGETSEGRVKVWRGSSTGIPSSAHWRAESNQANAFFGSSVASAGDVNGDGYDDVLIGAPQYDNGQTNEGMVFLWKGSNGGLGNNGTPSNVDWTAESNQASALFGTSVASAGDVNGDTYGDIIVGATQYANGQTDEGAAFVWYGSGSGLGSNGTPSNADWSAESNQAHGALGDVEFGISVASAGDINGDGIGDIIVGSSFYSSDFSTNPGAAFLWQGSSSGLGASGTPGNAYVLVGEEQAAWFGFSVAGAGDVDGDGYDDVVVGAPLQDTSYTNGGRAYLFMGEPPSCQVTCQTTYCKAQDLLCYADCTGSCCTYTDCVSQACNVESCPQNTCSGSCN